MSSKPIPFDDPRQIEMFPELAIEQPNQLYSSVDETFSSCLATLRKKNSDYASSEDLYKNFTTVLRLGISVQQGIMVRLLDKITRLENLLTHAPYVTEESFEDTIDDAINYLAILKARRQLEKSE